jgi:hypothetical protein
MLPEFSGKRFGVPRLLPILVDRAGKVTGLWIFLSSALSSSGAPVDGAKKSDYLRGSSTDVLSRA